MTWLKQKWKWILLGVLIVIFATASLYTWSLYRSLDGLNKPPDSSLLPKPKDPAQPIYTPPKWEGTERVNILLLGADSRGIETGEVPRSDTMLIASVDPITKQATLMSLLRDVYIPIPGHGNDRANAALAFGGPELAMKAIGDYTGLHIQYYIYTDFQGFISLIDELGGIEFNVEKDMKYRSKADGPEYDINLKKGLQMLDGKSALQYVRFRHDAMSDFSRTQRQRDLMVAVANKMKSVWSIMNLPQLIESISPYIDTNLEVSDMLKLGSLALDMKVGTTHQVPGQDMIYDRKIGSSSVIDLRQGYDVPTYVKRILEGSASTVID
ncbi:LCP family protein [Paenibacillus agilis]|uniref:LytR family transcriptional regulator n=1 Tax=Paenibacillus agilis TaxID=3020863 RepID=A0A559IL35_9BACL|nr:LCP family protein [Paenibacillus agilis]TVX88376.1 LytR family transcriptional regulator [Paenibacillus agilis]